MSSTEPDGSARLTAAVSARMSAAVPLLRNRYSICALDGAPGARSRASSAGDTQPPAELVTEVAMPTTVSSGWPGALVTRSLAAQREADLHVAGRVAFQHQLARPAGPVPGFQGDLIDRTARRGPPGQGQRGQRAGPGWPGNCAATVVSANGPAAPVTPGSLRVAARSAAVARDWSTTTAR